MGIEISRKSYVGINDLVCISPLCSYNINDAMYRKELFYASEIPTQIDGASLQEFKTIIENVFIALGSSNPYPRLYCRIRVLHSGIGIFWLGPRFIGASGFGNFEATKYFVSEQRFWFDKSEYYLLKTYGYAYSSHQ